MHAPNLHTMEKFLLCMLFLSTLTQCSFATPCHSKCICFWKEGKRSAECSYGGFETIPSGLEPSTQVLTLRHNNFTVLPRNAFLDVGLVNLQKLYLDSCGIERIDDSALKMLSNLVELRLDDNLLSYVPTAAFRHLPSLRILGLSGNPLVVVPTLAFGDLKFLKILQMFDCKIRTIATRAFEGLEKLEVLRVNSNELSTLRVDTLKMLKSLSEMSLYGNPWTCDCELRRLQQWLSDYNVAYSMPPTCYRPVRLRDKGWHEVKVEDYDCAPTFLNTTSAVDVLEEEEGGKPNGEEQGISMVIGIVLEILSAVL